MLWKWLLGLVLLASVGTLGWMLFIADAENTFSSRAVDSEMKQEQGLSTEQDDARKKQLRSLGYLNP